MECSLKYSTVQKKPLETSPNLRLNCPNMPHCNRTLHANYESTRVVNTGGKRKSIPLVLATFQSCVNDSQLLECRYKAGNQRDEETGTTPQAE